jgi:hypothetical protein
VHSGGPPALAHGTKPNGVAARLTLLATRPSGPVSEGQLILCMLQPCTSIIKEVRLDVTAAIRLHQLIVHRLDLHLKMVVLLEELLVALLNVLDGAVLLLNPVVVLLQAHTLEGASRRGLLNQGAHVLGVACRECPTRVVSLTLGVANGGQALTPNCVALIPDGEQGNGGAVEARQVALTKLHEGLVGNPIQSIIDVITLSRGEPSHHARVGRVSQDVHVDLAT